MNSRSKFIPNLKAVRFKKVNKTDESQTIATDETKVATDSVDIEQKPSVDSLTDRSKQRTFVQHEGLFAASAATSDNSFGYDYVDLPKCLQDSSVDRTLCDRETNSKFVREHDIFDDADFVMFQMPKTLDIENCSENGQIGKLVQLRSGKWKFKLNNGQLLDVKQNDAHHTDSLLTNFDFDTKTNIGNIINLGVKTNFYSIKFDN